MYTIGLRYLLQISLVSFGFAAAAGVQSDHLNPEPIDFVALDGDGGNIDCTQAAPSAPSCRVRAAPDVPQLARLLAQGEHVSRQGDTLTFVYRGAAKQVWLMGGLQYPLSRVTDTELWTLTLRVQRLDHLAFSYTFAPDQRGPTELPAPVEWRGPRAAAAPQRVERLQGTLVVRTPPSAFLPAPRPLSIYEPPALAGQPLAGVVYAADGENIERFAKIAEPLMLSGRLPRMLLVGLHAAPGSQRWYEYVLALQRGHPAFGPHEQWLMQEVVPLIERSHAVPRTAASRILFGYSNGADWAVATALRNPQAFGHVIALSPSWPAPLTQPSEARRVTFFIAAGTLEPSFLKSAREISALFQRHNVAHTLREDLRGHDMTQWEGLLPEALLWTQQASTTPTH
ncbi:MAG: alpha/beta hydrolase [Lysobacterales bacterium]